VQVGLHFAVPVLPAPGFLVSPSNDFSVFIRVHPWLKTIVMLRAFSTLGCPQATLDEALTIAAAHGLAGIEIRTLGGTAELPDYLAKEFGSPEKLADRLRAARVRVVALDTSLRVIDGAVADREKFLQYVPWAEALGVPRLRVFDGGKNGDAAEMAGAAETIGWWRRLRRENGWKVDLMIETHDALVRSPVIRRFFETIPGASLLWDAHHTWRKGGEDPVATWRAIHEGVVHVHVKDSIDQPSARHPFTYVLPGRGGFPMAALREALAAGGFRGPLSLEWERWWHPYLPPVEDALGAASAGKWW
jgi:sugar phosphate isomerase/epimerase